MNPNQARSFISIFAILLIVSACSADSPSATPTTEEFDSELVPITLTDAAVIWPKVSADECAPSLPAPSIKICLENTSGEAASPGDVSVVLPAFLASAAFKQVLGSLPGGEWLPPYPITLTGIPGVTEGSEGIVIVNTNPAPDASAVGIIIINTIPASSDVSSVFIVFQNMPDPLTAEGIIIVNTKEGAQSITGAVTLNFEILSKLNPSQPMSDTSFGPGFAEVAADITQDAYEVTAVMDGMLEFSPLEDIQQMSGGIIWGALVGKVSDEYINSSPLVLGIDFGVPPDDNIPPPDDSIPPPDDGKTAIVWGGMPSGAVGIVIVNTIPSPNSEAEGIIIVNTKDISQVMGIKMADKPGVDGSSQGIVQQYSPPPDDNLPPPDDSKVAIAWDGLVWGDMPGSDQNSKSIIIVEGMPDMGVASAIWTGLPAGFGLPEGMMPMMGDFGFGPMAFGQLAFKDDSFVVPAQEEKCFEILLSGLIPYLPGSGGETYPVDSFFDVFTELTVGMRQEGEGNVIVSRIDSPIDNLCTPTPGIATYIPELATPIPTRPAAQPTPKPTIRTGLPTAAPFTPRRLPTATPAGRSN